MAAELPLELLEANIGKPVWVISRGEEEYAGTLEGFDENLNIVLTDLTVHSRDKAKRQLKKALIQRDQVNLIVPGALEGPAPPLARA